MNYNAYSTNKITWTSMWTSDIEKLLTDGLFLPKIKDIRFFDNKATVVYWSNNSAPTRVVVKEGDVFSEEIGVAMAIAKKFYGSYQKMQGSINKAKRFSGGKKVKKEKPKKRSG